MKQYRLVEHTGVSGGRYWDIQKKHWLYGWMHLATCYNEADARATFAKAVSGAVPFDRVVAQASVGDHGTAEHFVFPNEKTNT